MSNEIKIFFDKIAPIWDEKSLERKEELEALLSYLPLKQGMKVLDIACGTGVLTPILFDITKVKVKAIDISGKMIEIAKKKFLNNSEMEFEVKDFLKINEKEKYDIAIIFNAYPHFLNPKEVAEKLNQVLVERGYFAILHNCSREDLEKCHKNIMNISRSLSPIIEEQKYFEGYFKILISLEEKDKIILLGQKKN